MAYGYAGRILEVDLSREKTRLVELDDEVLEAFIGGRGLGAYLLMREFHGEWEGLDPLSPRNPLYFLTGPLTGYYPGVKLLVTAKSPQSNGIVGSVLSSEVAIELRAAGLDGLVVRGAAKSPVYVYVENGEAEIRDAEHLWGLGGRETFRRLRDELYRELLSRHLNRDGLPREPAFVYIGPAGENRVRTAAVMAKWVHAAGYGGYGAVMGSKNLKAVAVRGTGPMPRAKWPGWVRMLIQAAWEKLNGNTLTKYWGTGLGAYMVAARTSSEPVRNWREEWHRNRNLAPQAFEAHWVKRYWGDYGCPSTCMKVSFLRNGRYAGSATDAPDYELQAYLGPNLGVFEPRAVIHLSYLADELGLCGIQTGNVMGFAAELYERGVLTREDLGGLELKWGDADAFARLMEMIARREGIGDLLAEGVYRAARRISEWKGVDVSDCAVHVKGIGVGAHGVRSGKDFPAYSYPVGVQGGDHTSAPRLPVTKMWGEHWATFVDSAVICAFNADDKLPFEFLKAITGWDVDMERWAREHAKRILAVQRLALLLGGPDAYWDPRRDDDLPKRFYEPLPSGPFKGKAPRREEVEEKRLEYYGEVGWDRLGVPSDETLEELGLGWLRGAAERVRRRLGG